MRLNQALSVLVGDKTAAQTTHGGEAFAKATAAEHKDGLGFVPLSKIEAQTKEAMFEELVNSGTFSRETLEKIAEVTTEEAVRALSRLKKLEEGKPSTGELTRGAIVGATIGPAATLTSRIISGRAAAGGLPHYRGLRDLGASAATGALFGGAMPAARHKLERNVEKHKIKEYLDQNGSGSVRRKIRGTLGV